MIMILWLKNGNKNDKNRSRSEFHDNRSFNTSFNKDVINPIDPTNDLVISSYKNMNNGNNYKIMENIIKNDVGTTEIIVDGTNKLNDIEKRTKENLTGKLSSG